MITAVFLATVTLNASGCIEDADCGICDPDSLIVESFTGLNYATRRIHVVSPECIGEDCPAPFDTANYYVDEVGPCVETEEAKESGNPEEYCKLTPLLTWDGLEIIFNNLLDPTSVELVRKRPDNPQLFEVYDWKSRILKITGPITRFNGDYNQDKFQERDQHNVSRLINLSCIENLADQGIPFTHESYADPDTNPCNTFDVATGRPMKMRLDGTLTSYKGVWSASGNDCTTTAENADDCCTFCEWALSTQVARYGVTDTGELRNPNAGTAITCDPTAGDPLIQCRDFVTQVNRDEEYLSWSYYWECDPSEPGCEPGQYKVPEFDRLRETHPDDRPEWLLTSTARCTNTADCATRHDLPGTQCVGTNESGDACIVGGPDATCGAATGNLGICQPSWFVSCRANPDTTGGEVGYCVDTRFDDSGTAACFRGTEPFDALCTDGSCQTASAGTTLAYCDHNNDGNLTAEECCQESLGAPEDGSACDPFYLPNVTPTARYKRDQTLPEQTRTCICEENPREGCEEAVRLGCLDESGNLRPERIGQYAVKFVARFGGVIYDPAVKGIQWRPADQGGTLRGLVERCAASGVAGFPARNRLDGWSTSESAFPENWTENFDRAMCSGSTYTVEFQEPAEGAEFVRDKVGNTLEGKNRYTFETPDFHLVPNSGSPSENLRISACGTFSMRFSNRYDLSPENIAKLQIFRVDPSCNPLDNNCQIIGPSEQCTDNTRPAAGGPGCYETGDALAAARETDPCAAPCLIADLSDQFRGILEVWIDPVEFGAVLEEGEKYWLLAPGLGSMDELEDPELGPTKYKQVFWDACGMPLVLGNQIPYQYIFTIDAPKCSEDEDQDNIEFRCDNAQDHYNPDQADLDRDGIGDVIDICPVVPGGNNTADSDKDGVGNDCDSCRQAVKQYNADAEASAVPFEFRIRNIPYQSDADQDGIGDVCDNCVQTANCEDYGADNPARVDDPVAFDNENLCQRDDDSDMIGDVCEGQTGENAAGPVGYAESDDFDQDGIVNADDSCPRQPIEAVVECTANEECGDGGRCTAGGVCNHRDIDADGVGDICDTCPDRPNSMQVVMGGMEEDDADGDFVGSVCETTSACSTVTDPRPFGFFPVASSEACCTVQLIEDEVTGDLARIIDVDRDGSVTTRPLLDPDGLPIRRDCNEDVEPKTCRLLPPSVASLPGVVELPAGCGEALTAAYGEGEPIDLALENLARRVTSDDVEGDLNALWGNLCFLPQFDQDFDGLGERCDLCPRAFDPGNLPYLDANGRVWPRNGAFCEGMYDPDAICEGMDEETAGTGTGGDESGGSGGTGGGTAGTGG